MKPRRAYYAGAARIVVDSIPCRVARPYSAHNLKSLRDYEKWSSRELPFSNDRERRETRAREARDAITAYADTLEITVTRAEALIAVHRAHLLANPLLDISLEYDL